MNNKKLFFYPLIILIIFLIIFLIGAKKNDYDQSEFKLSNEELTLKEAIVLGLEAAKRWNEKAVLYKLTSSDEDNGGTRGETGKRYNWNLFFNVPGSEKQLLLGISKGAIDLEEEIIGPKDTIPINLKDIKFDSPELLKIVKERYNLRQGEGWATGYHFTLDTIDNKTIATVVGIDKEDLFTKVNIDPIKGKITGAIHKTPIGGGLISKSLNFNPTKIIKEGMDISGVSANLDRLVTWGDQTPRGFLTEQPFIELSNDNGGSWTALNIPQNVVSAWFNSENELYVTTDSEVVRFNTENIMESILTLNTQIKLVDYSTHNNISLLSDKYIYATNDNGESWSKNSVPEPILSLQISESGSLIVFTHDRKVLLKNDEIWETIKLPTHDIEPSDVKVIKDHLFFILGNELWVYNLKNESSNKLISDIQVDRLIKKGNNLFVVAYDGTIYLINERGGSNQFVANRLTSIEEEIVADVEITQNGIFIATKLDYIWKKIN